MSDINQKIEELANLMAEFGLTEATLRTDDFKIHFSKETKAATPFMVGVGAPQEAVPTAAVAPIGTGKKEASAPAVKGTPITTPMMGVFYSAPSPGAPAFVKEGDTVTSGQVVGLIEAMKVFNEITSAISGTVVQCVATSGELVNAGDTLLIIG